MRVGRRSVLPTPVPTRPRIIIVTAPPIFILPPTPTPQPVFTIAPILILQPTLPPIRPICIDPLLGC